MSLILKLGIIVCCFVIVSCSSSGRHFTPSEYLNLDLPPFYDAENESEYYGRCPKCNNWVKGYLTCWIGENSGGMDITGDCSHCIISLVTDDPQIDESSRLVSWQQVSINLQDPVAEEPVETLYLREYVVHEGDTLSKISREFSVSISDIKKVNDFENPDLIRTGEVIKLPPATLNR